MPDPPPKVDQRMGCDLCYCCLEFELIKISNFGIGVLNGKLIKI